MPPPESTVVSQTFSTPLCGAIQASRLPSGDSRGATRSGLPKRTWRGMRTTMAVPNHDRMTSAQPGRLVPRPDQSPAAGRLIAMDGQSESIVDLAAIRANVAALVSHVSGAAVMAVVKSDGYGHGLMPTAAAALAGGATWLGVGH